MRIYISLLVFYCLCFPLVNYFEEVFLELHILPELKKKKSKATLKMLLTVPSGGKNM